MIDFKFRNAGILIVDDNQANIDILAGLLEMEGYENVNTTTDPRLTVGLFESLHPDLILLDLMMPHLNGFEVMIQLKEIILPDTYLPILVLTADMSVESKQRALAGGAIDFLVKPFDLVEVALRIKNLLFARFLHQQLHTHNQVLEERVRERTIELEQSNIELIAARDKAQESDRLKAAFLNNISHEIRTPFNGILGFLSLLQEHDLPANDRDEYIGIVNKSAYRLMNTINDIVEISQIQAGQMNPEVSKTDINALTAELVSHFKTEAECKGLEFTINNNLPDSLEYIYTDERKLKSILSNLIDNAVKFTNSGSIEFGIRLNAYYLEFSVKDTGIGIPEDKHQVIFERFMQVDGSNTRQYEGSGLGLSIAKAHVEMLRGSIRLESEEGKGTTFYVEIPWQPPKTIVQKPAEEPQNPEVTVHQPLKILVAEDDTVNFDYIHLVLNKANFTVLRAFTGGEAIELCRQNSDIDLILMDIKMPGMDGYAATGEIRRFKPEIPIVAITAYALTNESKTALAAGCNDYLAKPVKKEELLAVITKYV